MKSPRAAQLISPTGFVTLAVLLTLAYWTADTLGWRQYTGILSGTRPTPEGSYASDTFCGLVYAALHFAFVMLVPILLIAAALLFALQRRTFRVW